MSKFLFYDIDENYINYLKLFDNKVPDVKYRGTDKFFCGIVLNINNTSYYAPVSSFKEQQQTNFVIKDKFGNNLSSIRFSFMIPVYEKSLLEPKIFKNEKDHYLLRKEWVCCMSELKKIYNLAHKVYKIGCNKKHKLNYNCCDFKLLEKVGKEYDYNNINLSTNKDITVCEEVGIMQTNE